MKLRISKYRVISLVGLVIVLALVNLILKSLGINNYLVTISIGLVLGSMSGMWANHMNAKREREERRLEK